METTLCWFSEVSREAICGVNSSHLHQALRIHLLFFALEFEKVEQKPIKTKCYLRQREPSSRNHANPSTTSPSFVQNISRRIDINNLVKRRDPLGTSRKITARIRNDGRTREPTCVRKRRRISPEHLASIDKRPGPDFGIDKPLHDHDVACRPCDRRPGNRTRPPAGHADIADRAGETATGDPK